MTQHVKHEGRQAKCSLFLSTCGGKGGVGTADVVEVEQLRLLVVAMVGRKQVGVTEFLHPCFYFYIRVLIFISVF